MLPRQGIGTCNQKRKIKQNNTRERERERSHHMRTHIPELMCEQTYVVDQADSVFLGLKLVTTWQA